MPAGANSRKSSPPRDSFTWPTLQTRVRRLYCAVYCFDPVFCENTLKIDSTMGILSTILAIISLISALLLTVVILIQNPKGAGGIGSIGGGVSEAMFGATAPTALVKITVVLAIVFLASTLLNAAIVGHRNKARQKSIGSEIEETATTAPAAAFVTESST